MLKCYKNHKSDMANDYFKIEFIEKTFVYMFTPVKLFS